MISATNIEVRFGDRYLFRDVSLRIGPHDRIGLVGSNGAGKSTMLKILFGTFVPDKGDVAKAHFVTVGYLPQEGMSAAGRTLYDEVETVFSDIVETQARLEELHHGMEQADKGSEEFQEMLEVYGELQYKLEASDAFRMKMSIEKVLTGLGFADRDFSRRTEEFSGGWQMRIALAKLLLQQPSLLLLDEPTNHLDLDSLQWLEEYIRSYRGAVMIVSHDRRFLDNMTQRTVELSLGDLTEYAGNFTLYLATKEERTVQLRAARKNQQQQIRQTERFIERFRYKATKARQVQSRIKQLDKMEIIELEEQEGGIRFSFSPSPPSGKVAMELRGIKKSYGALTLFQGLDFDVDSGDRIAFVGVNGAGKSTLARIIAGVEPIDEGIRLIGHNVSISYFAQHQAEELNPEGDVLQTVEEVASGETRRQLRTLLGSFLFTGDDVFKRVSVLSGGEKSRLALAKMLIRPANVLVMDEPTNHLDVRSKAVLRDALAEFDGSFVIVSHDRDFLDPLVTKVVNFKAGAIRVYPGNLSDFLDRQRREEDAGTDQRKPQRDSVLTEKERKRREAEQRQRRYERTKPLQETISALEQQIEERERRKHDCEALLADPELYKDGDRVREVAAEYKALEASLTDDYYRWNALTKELEEVSRHDPPLKERR
jgi:ATP-binding cassette subfamily F protein 3